jgi:IS5 family transposase
MIGTLPDKSRRELFQPPLEAIIDLRHELALPANKIEWAYFEKEFAPLYAPAGQPSFPIRLMAGCLMLKQLKDLGEETLAKEWIENPYMQYFRRMKCFEHRFPFDRSDFVPIRKRIGEAGFEKILAYSVKPHEGRMSGRGWHLSDTAVQEHHTTYPTDAKLCKETIDRCNNMAKEAGIHVRRSYRRESKELERASYNGDHPRRRKQAPKARKRHKTIANAQIREVKRKLSAEGLKRGEQQ